MNLKNLHKSQLKAKLYEIISCPGVLSESEVFDVMSEVIEELGDDLGGKDA